MKRYIILFAISVLAFASCSKDDSTPAVQEKNGISLNVICSKMSPATKEGITGTKPGETEYNENIIKTIDYYFYPEGKEDQNSVLHARVSPNQLSQYTFNISVDEDMVNTKLFPRPSENCTVAVLVNFPGEHPATNTKLVDIQNLPLVLQLTGDAKPRGKDQSEFVMFGIGAINHIERKKTQVAELEVEVHRVAAKITLDAHVASSIIAPIELIDGSKTYVLRQEWRPVIDEMTIYLENGNRNAIVSGDPEAVEYSFFKYDQREFSGLASHTIERQIYTTADYDANPPVYPQPTGEKETVTYDDFHKSKPFYTYPQTWSTGSEHEPFLKLVLPWTRIAGNDSLDYPELEKPHKWTSTKRQFYYRILLPNVATGFVSNNWYHINLDVAILGSDVDDAGVEIEGSYYVVPWGSADPVIAEIKGARYLSVSKQVDTMYNTEILKLPYVTSNECTIEKITVKQYDYSSKNYSYHYYYNNVDLDSCPWVSLDDNNSIVINHSLNNDISTTDFDVAPYEFSFRLRHKDAGGAVYYREISVVQYPGMYIKAVTSTGDVFIKGTRNNFDNQQQYIYDDRDRNRNNMGVLLSKRYAMSVGENSNPNLYTIHVTVLPDNYPNSIGDPRVSVGISGTDQNSLIYRLNNLTNYKPTAGNTTDIIAPVFKVASSYGQTSPLSYEGAVQRCAAYKESGYPAGRWRLPTQAEILYLITLSDKGKIPELFSPTSTSGYWAAGESFLVKRNSGALDFETNISGYSVYARCVYDVWYWGDKQQSTTEWGGYQTKEP